MKKVLFIIASLIAAGAMCAAGCASDKTKIERDEKPYGLIEELPQETEKPQEAPEEKTEEAPREPLVRPRIPRKPRRGENTPPDLRRIPRVGNGQKPIPVKP